MRRGVYKPRFARRVTTLARRAKGHRVRERRDFSAAAPPVHSAIGFIIFGARFQRGGTPGSFGDWLYHFRGEIAARRQPRFIRRLALSFSGKARFQRGRTTPVRQAIASSSSILSRQREKEDIDGADLACRTTRGDHMRANKSRGGTKDDPSAHPVLFVIGWCVL